MKTLTEEDRNKLLVVISDPETDTSYMAFRNAIAKDDKKEESK